MIVTISLQESEVKLLAFVHEHVHTTYSTLDGMGQVEELVAQAIAYGMEALAITDHRNMSGHITFYNECNKWMKCPHCGSWTKEKDGMFKCCSQPLPKDMSGIQRFKPLLGCEVEETEDRKLHDRNAMKENGYKNNHLILIAKNEKGYENLVKIVSDSAIMGYFDKKERTQIDWIKENGYGEGLICMTACLGGRVSRCILEGRTADAVTFIEELKTVFDEVYLELQDNDTKDQGLVNTILVELHKHLGYPLVATKDVHYVRQADADAHDTLLCIQTNNRKSDADRWRFSGGPDYYLCSEGEMRLWADRQADELKPYFHQAIDNTKLIADKCNVTLNLHQRLMPDFPVPSAYDLNSWLHKVALDGLVSLIQKNKLYAPLEEYIERFEMELDVICSKGFAGYFLILQDMVEWAASQKIKTGPGRGSAAGSLLAYLLDITKMDPIRHGFLFERFLNPERNSFPDIDLDVCYERRPELIEYVMQKYGQDHVAQIVTFTKMGVKSGIRNLMRVREYPYAQSEELAGLAPDKMPDQGSVTLDKIVATATDDNGEYTEKYGDKFVAECKAFMACLNQYPDVKRELERLEGVITATGIHAAGVIITPGPVQQYVPLTGASAKAVLPVTAWDLSDLDYVGTLKMDLLGLRTLTVIDMACRNIKETTGRDIDIEEVDLDDPNVYRLLRDGHTHAVFQLAGGGITKLLRDVRPFDFDAIIDVLALFRPGPLDAKMETGFTMVEQYVENRRGATIKYEHPDLQSIMQTTYGVMIYQEQIMSTVQKFAGYTLGGADNFRRVIGKKKVETVEGLRTEFINGSKDGKVPGGLVLKYAEQFLNHLFDQVKAFAGYGFNRSHSGSYAKLSYQTAWLKCYYPTEFMAAVLTSEADKTDKTAANIQECRRLGIKLLPPSVNHSMKGFTIENGAIRFGLKSIKEVGDNAIEEIVKHRPYTSVQDFYERVNKRPLNKKVLVALLKAGVFDEFEPNRHKLLNQYHFELRGDKEFNGPGAPPTKGNEVARYDESQFDDKLKLAYEREWMGLYISGHPLENLPFTPWDDIEDGGTAELGGIVLSVEVRKSRFGDKEFGRFCLETQGQSIWVNAFGKVWEENKSKVTKGATIIVEGEKSAKYNNLSASKILTRKRKPKPNANITDIIEDYDVERVVKPNPLAELLVPTSVVEINPDAEKSVEQQVKEAMESDDPLRAIFGF